MLQTSKRVSAAHKHLLAMKLEGESSLSPSMSSEWRSKYLEKLRINPHMTTGVPRDGRAGTDPSNRLSAPIMIPKKTRSTSLEDPTYCSPHHRLSWEDSLSPLPLPPLRTSYTSPSTDADIDLDIGLFPMGSPESTCADNNDDDDDFGMDEDMEHPHRAATDGRRRRGFIPPHQMIQHDCFSLGVQHQFRKRPTGAAVI